MREFTEQFFDLLLNLDGNWRVTTVRSNYKDMGKYLMTYFYLQACLGSKSL